MSISRNIFQCFLIFCFLFFVSASDKRFIDHSQRVVIAPTVRIQEPGQGVSAAALEDALANGGAKKKMKAYRRSDSSGGNRSRSATKELALPADDSLMCPPTFLSGRN